MANISKVIREVPSVVLSITKNGHPFGDAAMDTHFMNNAVGIAVVANFVT